MVPGIQVWHLVGSVLEYFKQLGISFTHIIFPSSSWAENPSVVLRQVQAVKNGVPPEGVDPLMQVSHLEVSTVLYNSQFSIT